MRTSRSASRTGGVLLGFVLGCSQPPVHPGTFAGSSDLGTTQDVGLVAMDDAPAPGDVAAMDRAPGIDSGSDASVAQDVAAEAALPDATATDTTVDAASSTDAPAGDGGVDAPLRDAPDASDALDASDVFDATDAPDGSDVRDVSDVQDVSVAADVGPGACTAGFTSCAVDGGPPVCAFLGGDVFNCGACGRVCCGSMGCVGGRCTNNHCPFTLTPCTSPTPGPGGCVLTNCIDLMNDDQNCGACGRACTGGTACLSGTCL